MTFEQHVKLIFPVIFGLILLGVYSVVSNTVQLLPDVDPPRISFTVKWPGASENLLLTQVVEPYEQALKNKLAQLHSVEVKLAQEQATFVATFAFSANLTDAEQNIRTLLSRTRPLPLNAPPVVFRQGGNNVSNRVVGSYFITADSGDFSPEQRQIIKNIALQQLSTVVGIDTVELNPVLERQLVFKLDPIKMAYYSVSYQQVSEVISELFNQPTGSLYQGDEVISLRYAASTELADFSQTPVVFVDGVAIVLGDFSTIEIAPVRSTAAVRFNGQQAIAMRVLRMSNANLLVLQQAVDAILLKNKTLLNNAGLSFHLSFDTTLFIERAINWVIGAILAGFVLSLLVSYWFLRRVSPTLLGGMITLLSICGTLIVMNLFNVSINVISLAGITFAIGMFVDGVLIIAEYLDRHNESTKDAVLKRVRQLAPALIASVLTSVVVFSPVIINDGAEGGLFAGLAIAIVSGLVISLLLTLLIAPVFAFYFIKPIAAKQAPHSRWLQGLGKHTDSLSIRLVIVAFFCVGSVGLSVLLFPSLNYLPSVKRDAIDVFIPLPGANTVDFVETQVVNPLSDYILSDPQLPELKNAYALGWGHFATAALRLEDNSRLPAALAHLKKTLPAKFPDHRVIVVQGNLFGGIEDQNNIELQIFTADQAWLVANLAKIKALISDNIPAVRVRFDPNLSKAGAVRLLSPNRDNLRDMAVPERELKALLKVITDTEYAGLWSHQGESLPAYIRFDKTRSLAHYLDMPFVTRQGQQTFVGELVKVQSSHILPPLKRINGVSAITVKIALKDKKVSVSTVVDALEQSVLPQLRQLLADKGYVEVQGSAASLYKAKVFFALMLVFVFLAFFVIVALVYQSARLSFYVVMTLPFALCGGILGFRLLDSVSAQSFDVLTMIGFMIMLGVVANNAILLIDAINQAYQTRVSLSQAVAKGMQDRLRSILVSTCTTVAGMLPLLLIPSDASGIYRGIAAVIVGGIVANLLAVFAVTAAMVKQFGLVDKNNKDKVMV